ncbi:hypothetical protein H2201_003627 [Coniosporium apollinis]|uniref:DUF6590 domain-containing protein n=1 Tax=Coniosporium apollinis TaxID=61459 RepID=A0ABQ9NW62_9PEZI|nr:hypothetical protein H2201_003627 [Coniosporium apollinis]
MTTRRKGAQILGTGDMKPILLVQEAIHLATGPNLLATEPIPLFMEATRPALEAVRPAMEVTQLVTGATKLPMAAIPRAMEATQRAMKAIQRALEATQLVMRATKLPMGAPPLATEVTPRATEVEAEIRGTHGETEPLDPTFFKRPDPGSFFVEGKVIAVLHTEGLGEDTRVDAQNLNVNITEVKHGERAYTNIRRFVVVHPRKGFCYACPISTYGNRATTKQGADQRAHGVIYTGRDPPRLKYGEAGIEKDPVRLIPSDRRIFLSPESRINYALCYPIQNNVKVKDLGRIAPEHLQKVAGYWRMEMDR